MYSSKICDEHSIPLCFSSLIVWGVRFFLWTFRLISHIFPPLFTFDFIYCATLMIFLLLISFILSVMCFFMNFVLSINTVFLYIFLCFGIVLSVYFLGRFFSVVVKRKFVKITKFLKIWCPWLWLYFDFNNSFSCLSSSTFNLFSWWEFELYSLACFSNLFRMRFLDVLMWNSKTLVLK